MLTLLPATTLAAPSIAQPGTGAPAGPGVTVQRFTATRGDRVMAGDVDGDGRLSAGGRAAAHRSRPPAGDRRTG